LWHNKESNVFLLAVFKYLSGQFEKMRIFGFAYHRNTT